MSSWFVTRVRCSHSGSVVDSPRLGPTMWLGVTECVFVMSGEFLPMNPMSWAASLVAGDGRGGRSNCKVEVCRLFGK